MKEETNDVCLNEDLFLEYISQTMSEEDKRWLEGFVKKYPKV